MSPDGIDSSALDPLRFRFEINLAISYFFSPRLQKMVDMIKSPRNFIIMTRDVIDGSFCNYY